MSSTNTPVELWAETQRLIAEFKEAHLAYMLSQMPAQTIEIAFDQLVLRSARLSKRLRFFGNVVVRINVAEFKTTEVEFLPHPLRLLGGFWDVVHQTTEIPLGFLDYMTEHRSQGWFALRISRLTDLSFGPERLEACFTDRLESWRRCILWHLIESSKWRSLDPGTISMIPEAFIGCVDLEAAHFAAIEQAKSRLRDTSLSRLQCCFRNYCQTTSNSDAWGSALIDAREFDRACRRGLRHHQFSDPWRQRSLEYALCDYVNSKNFVNDFLVPYEIVNGWGLVSGGATTEQLALLLNIKYAWSSRVDTLKHYRYRFGLPSFRQQGRPTIPSYADANSFSCLQGLCIAVALVDPRYDIETKAEIFEQLLQPNFEANWRAYFPPK